MSNKYQEQMQAYARFGERAAANLWQKYHELFLSLPEADTASAQASWIRLHATELETPQSVEEMTVLLELALYNVLTSENIAIAEYGVSTAGQKQLDALLAKYKPAPLADVVATVADPKAEQRKQYQDVIDAFNGSSVELNSRMRNPDFNRRFTEAVGLGLI